MRNFAPLRLHVPEPSSRPGQEPDFSWVKVPDAGSVPRPDVAEAPHAMRELAYALIRVLDEHGAAVGPWNPRLEPETLRRGLRAMLLTRAYDERMFRAQRQGKTSFYMRCTGEEAIGVAQAMALDDRDMIFPTYRQQAILITRGWPLVDMMNQVFSNTGDRLKGRQMPIMYSSRQADFFSIAGNLATQFPQAVGWAMAVGHQARRPDRGGLDRRGRDGGGRFPPRADLRQRVSGAGGPQHRQQPVGHLVLPGHRGRRAHDLRGARLGYGLPGLRVDGNDFLAVYAVTRWAAERARIEPRADLIELFTYRASAHSTSDDPTQIPRRR